MRAAPPCRTRIGLQEVGRRQRRSTRASGEVSGRQAGAGPAPVGPGRAGSSGLGAGSTRSSRRRGGRAADLVEPAQGPRERRGAAVRRRRAAPGENATGSIGSRASSNRQVARGREGPRRPRSWSRSTRVDRCDAAAGRLHVAGSGRPACRGSVTWVRVEAGAVVEPAGGPRPSPWSTSRARPRSGRAGRCRRTRCVSSPTRISPWTLHGHLVAGDADPRVGRRRRRSPTRGRSPNGTRSPRRSPYTSAGSSTATANASHPRVMWSNGVSTVWSAHSPSARISSDAPGGSAPRGRSR